MNRILPSLLSLAALLCGIASLPGCVKPDMHPQDGILVGIDTCPTSGLVAKCFPTESIIVERLVAEVDADTEYVEKVFADPQGEALAVRLRINPFAAAARGAAGAADLVVAQFDGELVRVTRLRPGKLKFGQVGTQALVGINRFVQEGWCVIDPVTATYSVVSAPRGEVTGTVLYDQSKGGWMYAGTDRSPPILLTVDEDSKAPLQKYRSQCFGVKPIPGNRTTWSEGDSVLEIKLLVHPREAKLQLIDESGYIGAMTDAALVVAQNPKVETSGPKSVSDDKDFVFYTIAADGFWRRRPGVEEGDWYIGAFSWNSRWLQVYTGLSYIDPFGKLVHRILSAESPRSGSPGGFSTGLDSRLRTAWLKRQGACLGCRS